MESGQTAQAQAVEAGLPLGLTAVITRRDHFAAAALTGLLSNANYGINDVALAVSKAVAYADALTVQLAAVPAK